MDSNTLYEEKIASKWTTILFAFVTVFFMFMMFYQIFVGPLGEYPAPTWVLIVLVIIFLFLTFNFRAMTIELTPEFLSTGFGVVKHRIPWEDIERSWEDESPVWTYGGWGIRFEKSHGKRRLAYTVPQTPRVALSLKRGRFQEFIFSTRKPGELIGLINEMTSST